MHAKDVRPRLEQNKWSSNCLMAEWLLMLLLSAWLICVYNGEVWSGKYVPKKVEIKERKLNKDILFKNQVKNIN